METTPKVGGRYGSPMGRHSAPLDVDGPPVELAPVPLDCGGYDEGGAYWGCGEPLFSYHDGESVSYMRAASIAAARAQLEADGFKVESDDLAAMVSGYVEAVLFTENTPQTYRDEWREDEVCEGSLPDGLDESDFDEDALESIRSDCAEFLRRAGKLPDGLEIEQAGRDLWFDRQGHGVGFADRDLPEGEGERLAEIARGMGETWPHWGSDGRVHV